MLSAKIFLVLGSLNAMLAVILGAFGAHGLKGRIAENMLAVYQTGVQYHFYHALGLIVVGLIVMQTLPSIWFKSAGWLMLAGILLFSGSLYMLSVTQLRWLGAITPFGGTAFIFAWLALFVGIIRAQIN
jgi:uncharacterized membrane protein YgdD (TMEM256/DUF423 family)